MKIKILLLLFALFHIINLLPGQILKDSVNHEALEKGKKGFSFGAAPALAFDSDVGYKYGAVVNIFNYGKGGLYPDYLYSIYTEWSRTTKGCGINRIFFDSKYLIPKKTRITSDIAYLTEKALDFYGFNGYNAQYNSDYVDDSKTDYISRVYYRYERKLTRITIDLQKQITSKFRFLIGAGYFNNMIRSVDIKSLNKGLSKNELLPDTSSLYDNYISWGIIPEKQKNGGVTCLLKLGLVYDSRDNESNPMHGIWTEAFLLDAPGFAGKTNPNYNQFVFIHRQYMTLVKNRLAFAYRLAYQGKTGGQIPFYMLPFIFSTYDTRDGLGGARNLRGILRNRVTGDAVSYGNFEFRWKFFSTVILNQNVYLALSSFVDAGMVVKKYHFNTSLLSPDQLKTVEAGDEIPHCSYGSGLHIALNQNFMLSIDYGKAIDKRDGNQGLYLTMNYLF